MRPTLEYIKEKFDYYNKLCFDGQLPMPPIRLNWRYGQMGMTKYRSFLSPQGNIHNEDFSIEISIRRDLSEEEYIDTLVHEMIHYYIAFNNIVDNSPHGTVFRQKMDQIIRKYGIKITIAFDPSDEYLVNSVTRYRYVCVADLEDERMGIAVVARNKLFQFWETIEKSDGIRKVCWYASNRAIFGKYQVMVSPRLIIEDADKIHHYLTGAKELVNDGNVIKIKE